MDLSFVILCLDNNVGSLKSTIESIRTRSYNRSFVIVVPNSIDQDSFDQFKLLGTTIRSSKDTITNMVNTGIHKSSHDWNCILFSGTRVKILLERKIQVFAKNPNDILFPVVEGKYNFVDGCFNTVTVNRQFFQDVGNMVDCSMNKSGMNDFEMAKLFWFYDAVAKGANFKGIVGMKVN